MLTHNSLRREFLRLGLPAWLAGAVSLPTSSAASRDSWSFIHFTDIHVQPELRAAEGYRKCIEAMNSIKPKPRFAISGGDLIFDAIQQNFDRSDMLYKLFIDLSRKIDMPVHHTIGNHDVFAIGRDAKVPTTHPEFGKEMFRRRVGDGKTYRSFDYADWHFILLDSIFLTNTHSYIGRIDDEQLAWLKKDLETTGPKRPIVIVTHIPFFSIYPLIDRGATAAPDPTQAIVNGKEILAMLTPYNVKLILQGHLHIVEQHSYLGAQMIMSGAVCGNWWAGPRLGHPEGFSVYTVSNGAVTYRYHPYGWKA